MRARDVDMGWRDVLRTARGGLVGFVASGLLPSEVGVRHADAAVVTPDPIGACIQPGGVAFEIVAFAKPPASSSTWPYAALHCLYHARDGQVVTLRQAAGYSGRIDLRFGAGEVGASCVLTKQDGTVRKLRAA